MYIYCYSWCFSLCRKEEAALESAAAAATDVTTAMMAVKIELEEKKRTNDLLQRALVSEKNYSVETHFKGTRLIGAPSLRARCSRFAPANNFSPFPSPLQTCHVGHTGTPLLRTVFLVPKQTPPPPTPKRTSRYFFLWPMCTYLRNSIENCIVKLFTPLMVDKDFHVFVLFWDVCLSQTDIFFSQLSQVF